MPNATRFLADWHNTIAAQPLSHLLPYEAYDEERQLYTNRGSMGFVFQLSPLVGMDASLINLLNSFVEDSLPEKATLQVLLWACPYVGSWLKTWEFARGYRGGLFAELAHARQAYFASHPGTSSRGSLPFCLRDFQVIVSLTLPGVDAVTQKRLGSLRQQFLTLCQTLGVNQQRLAPPAFLSLIDCWVNPQFSLFLPPKIWDGGQRLNTQVGSPETLLVVKEKGLLLNQDWQVQTFSVREWPKEWSSWQMGELIGSLHKEALQFSCPFVLNLLIQKPSHLSVMRKAHVKSLRADKLAASPFVKLFPRALSIRHDWQYAKAQIDQGARFAEVFFQVVLYAPPQQSEETAQAAKAIFTANGFQLAQDRYLQLPMWLSMLPMSAGDAGWQGLRYFNRVKTVLTRNAVSLLPLQGEAKGSQSPGLLLTGRRGQVAWFDPFDNPEGNYNTAVAGKSGSGKSVLLQELMVSIAGSGGRVFVIDVGRSFEHSAKLLGGDFIAFHPGNPLSLNPFTHIEDFTESLSLLKPLVAVMASAQRALTDIEQAYIEQALQSVWQQYGKQSSFTLIAAWLNQHADSRANDIGTMLFPYTQQGMYGQWFEMPCTLNWDNPIVVLELEELKAKKDLQAVVLLVLLYHINDTMYRGNRLQRIACIIDEAWDLLRGEQAGYFMETGCRRARKYRGAFIAGTQSIHDYYQTPAARAVFDNADHVILLSQKAEAIEQLQQSKQLQLSAHGFELLKSLKTLKGQYAELLIKNPRGLQLARLCLDPFTQTLYATTAETYSAIQRLSEEGLPLMEAVKQVSQRGGQ